MSVACKTQEKRKPDKPSGPTPVASCDYKAEVLGGTNHRCLEIFDAGSIDAHERWCKELEGPRDHPTFVRGAACPSEGRKGGCLYPNGTIEWLYAGEPSCILGQSFERAPTIATATPYRCSTVPMCTEVMSVFDLTKTVEKKNCETRGGAFSMGLCSANDVVGRCATRDRSRDTTWVYYSPSLTPEQAKQSCDQLQGTFTPQR